MTRFDTKGGESPLLADQRLALSTRSGSRMVALTASRFRYSAPDFFLQSLVYRTESLPNRKTHLELSRSTVSFPYLPISSIATNDCFFVCTYTLKSLATETFSIFL